MNHRNTYYRGRDIERFLTQEAEKEAKDDEYNYNGAVIPKKEIIHAF